MNKEIYPNELYELLNELNNKEHYIEDYGYKYKRISLDDTQMLMLYIKHLENKNKELQQENETRQQDINNLTYQLAKMKEENERLKKDVELFKSDLISCINTGLSLITKIDKAIEYIKTEASYSDFRNMCEGILDYEKVNNLLNILQNGGD